RSGTTVGTVDYISPEQARDSGSADIRSDIYSLGCTLYHMLAGRPPFPEGSLTERIYKHCTVEPPDVRRLNPKVPEAMCAVLARMLAKKPEDRYPTPAALLKDLLDLDTAPAPVSDRNVLASLAFAAHEDVPDPEEPPAEDEAEGNQPDDAAAKEPADGARAVVAGKAGEQPAAKGGPRWLRQRPRPVVIWGVAAALAAAIVFGGLVALQMDEDANRPRERPKKDGNPPAVADSGPKGDPEPPRDGEGKKDAPGKKAPPPPPPPSWPALYRPSAPLDPARLRQEFQGPWTAPPAVPADAPVFRVSRITPHAAGVQSPAGTAFDSLAAACAAAPAGKMTVIEVHDNGPLFERGPITVSGRSLFVRAAPGYHPLIVWDTGGRNPVAPRNRASEAEAPPAPREAALLSVSQGDLLLRGLDLAVKWDATRTEPACLLRVAGGDLLAYLCTFSVAGRHPDGLTLARFDQGEAKPAEGAAPRCRFSQCFGRGNSLVALDVRAPRAEVLFDNCLFAGGDPPLLRVADHKDAPATLRAVRSTFVGRQTLLQVRPANRQGDLPGDASPRPGLRWMGWDALLARAGTGTGGVLVDLPAGADAADMKWRAVNCLYAGWHTLLSGREPIRVSSFDAWRKRWGLPEGDAAQPDPWPGAERAELAEVSPFLYVTDKTPLAFAATFGKGLLGCDLLTPDEGQGALPPGREAWLALTHDRYILPRLDMVRDASPPEIPAAEDGRYTGERLDVDRVDLGAHLDAVQKNRRLGPVVVMHLAGTG
ncbi:MAG TPA: hypothetical protein VFA26_20100, partial [Gemmataceae bacterium]|nr:hypothetical protein [Gemmataceae bacterium]